LAAWDWVYGKTPDFSVCKRYVLPAAMLQYAGKSDGGSSSVGVNLAVKLEVSKGVVVNAEVSVKAQIGHMPSLNLNPVTDLKGRRFTDHLLDVTIQRALFASANKGDSMYRDVFSNPFFDNSPAATCGGASAHINSILTCA
jgi:hypothetical protein